MKLDKFSWEWFGEARTVTISKEKTTIIDGKGDEVEVKQRLEELTTQIDNIILSLKDELGISLSPLFVKYSYLSSVDTKDLTDDDLRILKAFEGTEVMTEDDAREIASAIRSGKNPFGTNIDPDKIAESEQQVSTLTAAEEPKIQSEEDFENQEEDVEDDVDAAIGRLTKIAAGNAGGCAIGIGSTRSAASISMMGSAGGRMPLCKWYGARLYFGHKNLGAA